MSNPNFQWAFPPPPSDTSSRQTFTAQNASINSTGFGSSLVYVNDAIKLDWNNSSAGTQPTAIQYECGISPNGTRSRSGVGQAFEGLPSYIWTFEFLTEFDDSPSLPSAEIASETCVFFHHDSDGDVFYPTIAFSTLNTTRQGQPYIFTADSPLGTPYTPPRTPQSKSQSNTKLAAILGSVLGSLALLAVVVTLVVWRRKQSAAAARGKKDAMESQTHVELERSESAKASLPPPYEERTADEDAEGEILGR